MSIRTSGKWMQSNDRVLMQGFSLGLTHQSCCLWIFSSGVVAAPSCATFLGYPRSRDASIQSVASKRCVLNLRFPARLTGGMQNVIECEGSNIRGVWQRTGHVVDVDQIRSNDINTILKTYGVEMARATIVDEVSTVFGGYNIDVDRRHLELIADYMVHLSRAACFSF